MSEAKTSLQYTSNKGSYILPNISITSSVTDTGQLTTHVSGVKEISQNYSPTEGSIEVRPK